MGHLAQSREVGNGAGSSSGAPPISDLEVAVYKVPTEQAESDGTFTWDATTVVLVHVSAGNHRGLGFSYATPACGPVIEGLLRPAVLYSNPLDVTGTWAAMVAAIRNVGRPGVASMAIAAVDIALWDLKAKLLELPLCRLLGMARAEAPVYGSGGFTSYTDAQLADQLGGWANQGMSWVKMKVGTDWGRHPERDLARASVARRAIGDSVELFVDANGGYRRKQAIRLAARYSDYGVTWFEEPVSSDDLDGLREVRDQCLPDVAAGEYGYDLAYFQRMCAAGAVDVLQADVSRCAGITEWLRVAAVAAAHGLKISGHCAPSLHLHPACAVANLAHLEYFHDHARLDRLLFDGVVDPTCGALRPDLGHPGLGLELKAADAERYRQS